MRKWRGLSLSFLRLKREENVSIFVDGKNEILGSRFHENMINIQLRAEVKNSRLKWVEFQIAQQKGKEGKIEILTS